MAQQKRGQGAVLAVNAVVAVTVLALVAVLALVVNPPAPPGIAAFAPQASKPITKAPPGQSSASGEGAGVCGEGQVCAGMPTPTPSLSASRGPNAVGPSLAPIVRGVPSALQCYNWPDGKVTQTFDPQSPPCIATYDDTKGNGGATSPGVSATEIRVALPVATTGSTWPGATALVDFVNTRFQLYGRKIRIVPFPSQQAELQRTAPFSDPSAQRADAAQITQLKVFASHDFVDPFPYSPSLPVFRDVLTKNKIVSINGGETTPYGTAEGLAKNAPYEWSYYPPMDTLLENLATMTCRQLVGKSAAHAPDQALRSVTRKFAVLIPAEVRTGGPLPGLLSMLRILEGCGVASPKVVSYEYGNQNRPALAASFRELSADGVTTLIFHPGDGSAFPMDTATAANFRPEWLTIGENNYKTMFLSDSQPGQTSGAFGVGIWNKLPQLELEMWVQAFLASGGDQAAVSGGTLLIARALYQELMLLASGIQMAGPNLTPQSFADGLRATTFPNPGAAGAPTYKGTVGFEDGDAVMVDDFAAFWLDTRASGQDVQTSRNQNTFKATCYAMLGRRWFRDTWPRTDGFYQSGVCR